MHATSDWSGMFCTVVTLSASDLTSVRRLPYHSTNTRNLSLFWNVLEAVPIRDQDLWPIKSREICYTGRQAGRQVTHTGTHAYGLYSEVALAKKGSVFQTTCIKKMTTPQRKLQHIAKAYLPVFSNEIFLYRSSLPELNKPNLNCLFNCFLSSG